jgi:hypothetical protein
VAAEELRDIEVVEARGESGPDGGRQATSRGGVHGDQVEEVDWGRKVAKLIIRAHRRRSRLIMRSPLRVTGHTLG